jgi:hypothetical protein
MEWLALLGVPVLLALIVLVSIPILLYAGWIAAKVWVLLLVPLGFTAYPTTFFVGLGLVFACLRPNRPDETKDDGSEWYTKLGKALFIGFGAPTLAYFVALVIAHFAY